MTFCLQGSSVSLIFVVSPCRRMAGVSSLADSNGIFNFYSVCSCSKKNPKQPFSTSFDSCFYFIGVAFLVALGTACSWYSGFLCYIDGCAGTWQFVSWSLLSSARRWAFSSGPVLILPWAMGKGGTGLPRLSLGGRGYRAHFPLSLHWSPSSNTAECLLGHYPSNSDRPHASEAFSIYLVLLSIFFHCVIS